MQISANKNNSTTKPTTLRKKRLESVKKEAERGDSASLSRTAIRPQKQESSRVESLTKGLLSNFSSDNGNKVEESNGTQKTEAQDSSQKGSLRNTLKELGGASAEERTKLLNELEQTNPELAKLLSALLEGKKEGTEASSEGQKSPSSPVGESASGEGAAGPHAGGGSSAPKGPEAQLEGVPAGFLWKPSSESNGNLVLLLPPGMKGRSVQISGPNGEVLATAQKGGQQGKVANGGREHYRFDSPGAKFPPNSVVTVQTDRGSMNIRIPNPGIRNSGKGKK